MWQPIETAPRNQTFLAVLNCAGEQTICTMRWPVAEAKNSRPEVWGRHVERVTHWMPLPDLPGAQPAPSVPDGWLRAIDEALVVAHIDVANPDDTYEQARVKLDSLIGFHTDVATDPTVNGGWKLVPIDFAWPECPKRRQSHVLFDDGYEEGWAACVAAVKTMLAAAPEAKP